MTRDEVVQAVRGGWCDAWRAAGAIARTFLLDAPLILFVALPAMLAGYAWCYAVGAWIAGRECFMRRSVRVSIRLVPDDGGGE